MAPANKEDSSFGVNFSGLASGVLLDVPTFRFEISGSVQSGVLDVAKYAASLNSGQVSGVSIDAPTYSSVLNGGTTSGVLFDLPKYVIGLFGKMDRIYKENIYFSIDLVSGKIYSGGILFNLNTGDGLSVRFELLNGAIYGN